MLFICREMERFSFLGVGYSYCFSFRDKILKFLFLVLLNKGDVFFLVKEGFFFSKKGG